MNSKNSIEEQVDHVLEIGNSIGHVKASPFFKEKMMNRLFEEKKEEEWLIFTWFTPRLQLASLVCIVVLNIFAFTNLNSTSYEDNINEFAESYGLSSAEETSIFN